MVKRCNRCEKLFKFWEEGAGGWSSREREPIDCPHCGAENGQLVTGGSFRSEPMTADEERDFLEKGVEP